MIHLSLCENVSPGAGAQPREADSTAVTTLDLWGAVHDRAGILVPSAQGHAAHMTG